MDGDVAAVPRLPSTSTLQRISERQVWAQKQISAEINAWQIQLVMVIFPSCDHSLKNFKFAFSVFILIDRYVNDGGELMLQDQEMPKSDIGYSCPIEFLAVEYERLEAQDLADLEELYALEKTVGVEIPFAGRRLEKHLRLDRQMDLLVHKASDLPATSQRGCDWQAKLVDLQLILIEGNDYDPDERDRRHNLIRRLVKSIGRYVTPSSHPART